MDLDLNSIDIYMAQASFDHHLVDTTPNATIVFGQAGVDYMRLTMGLQERTKLIAGAISQQQGERVEKLGKQLVPKGVCREIQAL